MTLIHDSDIKSFPESMLSAFGVLGVADRTPVMQGDFVTGINTQMWQYVYVFTVTSPGSPPVYGDIYTNNNHAFTVIYSSGTTLVCNGDGSPSAPGNLTRVSGAGTTPIAFSAFTTQAGVTFGKGATIDTNSGRLRIQSGTNSAGYAYILSRRIGRYRAGEGMEMLLTPLFTAGVADNEQLWGVGTISNNTPYDGYFFSYNGTSFGITHYNRGTPTRYSRSADWNQDKCDGTGASGFNYNPTLGTPAMIKYPYLGYGDIEFFLQDSNTGRWILCHIIEYANSSATTQLGNPTMFAMGYTRNSGNTTNQTMYCGSIGLFICGLRSFVGDPKWAADNNKSGITTETAILNIRNCTNYNGAANRGLIRLHSISVGVTANAAAIAVLRLRINAAIGGTSTYATVSGTTADNGVTITAGNSIASTDTAGTMTSGGNYIFNLSVSAGTNGSGGAIIDLTPFEIFVAPGEILSACIFASGSAVASVSLNWSEDI